MHYFRDKVSPTTTGIQDPYRIRIALQSSSSLYLREQTGNDMSLKASQSKLILLEIRPPITSSGQEWLAMLIHLNLGLSISFKHLLQRLGCQEKVHLFGYILGVVRDSLERFRNENHFRIYVYFGCIVFHKFHEFLEIFSV